MHPGAMWCSSKAEGFALLLLVYKTTLEGVRDVPKEDKIYVSIEKDLSTGRISGARTIYEHSMK